MLFMDGMTTARAAVASPRVQQAAQQQQQRVDVTVSPAAPCLPAVLYMGILVEVSANISLWTMIAQVS